MKARAVSAPLEGTASAKRWTPPECRSRNFHGPGIVYFALMGEGRLDPELIAYLSRDHRRPLKPLGRSILKVGFTRSLERRIATFAVRPGAEVRLLGTVDTSLDQEHEFHRRARAAGLQSSGFPVWWSGQFPRSETYEWNDETQPALLEIALDVFAGSP